MVQVAGDDLHRRGQARGLALAAQRPDLRAGSGQGQDEFPADVPGGAGVAPTTLYRLFASKDDLIAAYVAANAGPYQQWVSEVTRPGLGTARTRILSLFDALAEQVQPDRCRGCPFRMTLAEFPEPAHPARLRAIATKAWVRERLAQLTADLADETPVGDPAALADQLALVLEGVYASVQALGADGPARQARRAAETLIAAASGRPDDRQQGPG